MIVKISDNIISPLGVSTEANYQAIRRGESELKPRPGAFSLPETFCGSLLDRSMIEELYDKHCTDADKYTLFEKLCILSATLALKDSGVDAAAHDTLFVLSSTKGNVDLLEENPDDPRAYISVSAEKIAGYFGNNNKPIVASNACISGVCAQIAAVRALSSGRYSKAVVIGADVLSKFIVSGFQSFKALSTECCRPYDKYRVGLNLGEAVGTLIIASKDSEASGCRWQYVASSNHNDANHISGPSRTGEGSFRVLRDILKNLDKSHLAFVNAHGTATAYNDEMESIAISRAELAELPVNGMKGYYGHTLGAAGVIETILSMAALDDNAVPGTKGYTEQGTSHALNISSEWRETRGDTFIKLLSGFGGSNAGIAWQKICADD